jgi:hypothetical protein
MFFGVLELIFGKKINLKLGDKKDRKIKIFFWNIEKVFYLCTPL